MTKEEQNITEKLNSKEKIKTKLSKIKELKTKEEQYIIYQILENILQRLLVLEKKPISLTQL